MNVKTITLAALLAVSSTMAMAQSSQGKAGSDNGPTSNSPSTMNPGGEMKNDSKMPSAKDASTQGAGTAGAANKKGDAASPGGTMKQ